MDEIKEKRMSWWSRQSPLRRLLFIAIPLLVVIALAVGLGVGLNSEHESGSSPSASPTILPPSNGTIWQPAVNSTWQIVLEEPLELSSNAKSVSPDVDVYDIDLFTNSKDTISTLQRLGKKVICYFSAGSYEAYRPDSDEFQSSDMGRELDGWPGEVWINVSSPSVRSIMTKRMDLAAEKGCDAVDPDNMDAYQNEDGLGLTETDAVEYVRFLSRGAVARNMSIGLKNADAIIPRVISLVHFSVNEQCHEYNECDAYEMFTDNDKPVFNIEYPDSAPEISTSQRKKYCATTGGGKGAENFSIMLKKMNLDGWVQYCDGQIETTEMSSG